MLIADVAAASVRRVDAAGRIATIADARTPNDLPEYVAETGALGAPTGVADAGSRVLIADARNEVIQALEAGRLHVVAGRGPGFGRLGDGGPATAADLSSPSDVAALPDGRFLIVDQGHQRVRRVAPDGTITTMAGSGERGFSGDGGPAVNAALDLPESVAVLADGTVLIADAGNNRVRAVGPDGTIRTVAGSGSSSGDETGPAAAVALDRPTAVAAHGYGFLVADSGGRRVRFVDASGVMRTTAGSGASGFTGDGGPALLATFTSPTALLSLHGDRILVADGAANAVRLIAEGSPPAPFRARWLRVPSSVRKSLPRRLAITVTRPAHDPRRQGATPCAHRVSRALHSSAAREGPARRSPKARRDAQVDGRRGRWISSDRDEERPDQVRDMQRRFAIALAAAAIWGGCADGDSSATEPSAAQISSSTVVLKVEAPSYREIGLATIEFPLPAPLSEAEWDALDLRLDRVRRGEVVAAAASRAADRNSITVVVAAARSRKARRGRFGLSVEGEARFAGGDALFGEPGASVLAPPFAPPRRDPRRPAPAHAVQPGTVATAQPVRTSATRDRCGRLTAPCAAKPRSGFSPGTGSSSGPTVACETGIPTSGAVASPPSRWTSSSGRRAGRGSGPSGCAPP